ncbi:ulp1 protease family, C-terminal catalytic domain-containing protein [Tanacetum coccineum]|uniref:Ulp1 protease family, C-terminal catalytic domain-containing protein n=1 Tax=Tanacetum coccineum TaxID=301880 RepID=A0ABQ4Y508_9ASTR
MRSNVSSTKSIGRKEQQGEQNESISKSQVDVPSSVLRMSNLSSTTTIVKLHCIKEETYCCLYIPSFVLAGEKVVCATATVYPIGDGILHFKKLLKGHIKVSVIKVVEIHKSMELPVPDDEIPNLESAVKGFIQWPIAAIARFTGMSKTPVSGVPTKRVMPQHENAPSTKKGKGNETPKEPNKQDKALEETTKHQKTMQKIDEVKERVEKEKASNKKSLQALEDESYFAINATYIIEFLTYQELECRIVTLFEMSLYHLKGHSSQNKVGFLNPGMITADSCFYEKWATIDYLTQSLTGYDFYLAPYLQGRHYVLFIICPKHGMGFILNSSKGSNTNEQSYRLAGLVESFATAVNMLVFPSLFDVCFATAVNMLVPWSNERPLENKELNAIIGAWFTLWRD